MPISRQLPIAQRLAALAACRPRARYRAAVPLATRAVIALPDAGRDALMRRLYHIRTPGRLGRG